MATELLDAYRRRVGVADSSVPDLDTLRRLHAAHVAAIPFENLDILLGRGISLELPRLVAKLAVGRRGGYCFEQNTLFLAVLTELGFRAMPMEARVRAGSTVLRPRTHMVIAVELDDRRWLADVGFGGEGLLEPVALDGTPSVPTAGLAHRIVVEEDLFVLQARRTAEWDDQYAFRFERMHPVDFEMANWFTSTYPQSPFVRGLTVQRTTPDVRFVLRYPTFTELRSSGVRTREISRAELIPLLREVFQIDLADNTIFPAIDGSSHGVGV
jgi:N-hydroxyarylamine O-acetyltransferase